MLTFTRRRLGKKKYYRLSAQNAGVKLREHLEGMRDHSNSRLILKYKNKIKSWLLEWTLSEM